MCDKDQFIDLINQQLASLQSQLNDVTNSAATVELDPSRVGRLSRMDALQAQAMHAESLARAKRQVVALKQALKRIENDDFGFCTQCDNEIAEARLRLNPSVTLCIVCAEKQEQSSRP